MKKALSRDFVLFGVFILIIATGVAVLYNLFNFSAAQSDAWRGAEGISDANLELHGIKQSFEKTALFFGLMSAAKEFGERGGVSKATITSATDSDLANNPAPKMDVTDGVLNLAVSRCKTLGTSESTIRKRMPFLSYADANFKLGTAPKKYTIVSAADYTETMGDVVRRDYPLNVLFSVIMLKEGSVDVRICQNANCVAVSPSITDTGTKIIPIGNSLVLDSLDDITIEFTGSAAGVAIIREIAVSIYDKDVVNNLNAALTANIESYRQKLKLQKVDIEPLNALFAPAGTGIYETLDNGEGFLRGVAYGPDKISASSSADDNLKNWNLAEEDAQIRYWRMYGFAKFFVDNYESWVKPRFFNELQATFMDRATLSKSNNCGSGRPSAYDPVQCPEDTTPHYTGEDFRRALNINVLDEISETLNDDLNAAGTDLRIEISIPPSPTFVGCSINTRPKADQLEWCTSQNMEYYKYKQGFAYTSPKCTPYSFPACGASESRQSSCKTNNICAVYYYQRYVLKNVPINVTIFDDKYNLFDPALKKWAPYRFTFFVEIDRIDDNTCGGGPYYCSDRTSGATVSMDEPEIILSESLLFTCENTEGQTCEAGVGCPVGKVDGSGTCETSELCCKNAPAGVTCADNGGSCYLLGACPEGENEVSKATISDCQEISKICCKAGAPPAPTCDLVDSFMGGCPLGMQFCSDGCVEIPFMNKVCCTVA